jgi:hypothetical protein
MNRNTTDDFTRYPSGNTLREGIQNKDEAYAEAKAERGTEGHERNWR